MKCNYCGAVLADGDICPNCGADVAIYRKIARVSNAYYNRGLEKAKVRDLTGACESLKTALALDKRNIPGRNLLGLVYLELGVVVEALSQWVISKNIQPENNLAGEYIEAVRSDDAHFNEITEAIKKYNLSLKYVQNGNRDMAMIQLKKITAQNPGLIQAQLLISLLYLAKKDYIRAKRHLSVILKIDHNNTLALSYMEEVQSMVRERKGGREKKEKTVERPLNGNDVIIPRGGYRTPSNGAASVVNVLVGAAIGAVLIWALIVPAKVRGVKANFNSDIQNYSEQLSDSNAQINSLQSQLDAVTKERDAYQNSSSQTAGGSAKALNSLVAAASASLNNNNLETAENLADIEDISVLTSDQAKNLYNKLSPVMTGQVSAIADKAKSLSAANNYAQAAVEFARAFRCDTTQADYVYNAAKAYEQASDTANAKKYYQIIVNDFKSSTYIEEADKYVSGH